MKAKILVLGASGKTGNATAIQLLHKGYPVRAFVRRLDSRSKELQQQGAEIFCGSLASVNDLTEALKGVERAYFVAPWEPEQLHIAMSFVVAAKNSPNLKALVTLTQWLASPEHPSQATRESYLSDVVFSLLPDLHCININVGWFADNYMPDAILAMVSQLGIFPFPLGNGQTAPISNEDIARVIVSCLENPEQHAGKTYRPTGPELLSPEQIAETFSELLGRDVRYQNIPEKMFLKALRMMGMSPHMQSQLQHYIRDYQAGAFARGAPNDVVKQLTGQEAEPFKDIAARYIQRSPQTEKNLGNKFNALIGFLKLLITPAHNLQAYQQTSNYIALDKPYYALESEQWLKQH